jgi:hypothetical protein
MLRSFTVLDPHLVNSIRENPRYTKTTPEEILGKFVSGRMMIKEARYVDEALNGPMPIHEPQTVALKATSSREALPSKVAQVEAAGLNEEEMTLIIKRFKTALKGHKERPNKSKTKGKHSYFKCGKTGHFIANCPIMIVTRDKRKAGRGKRRRPTRRRRARRTSTKNGTRIVRRPTPTMKDSPPRPSTSRRSSPTSGILIQWQRKRR